MVVVGFTLASTLENEGTTEHLRTYCYYVDGDTEESQGTIRDNRRGREIVDVVLRGSPSVVGGLPPEGANPVISCYLAVAGSRGAKSSHALSYTRHDFSSRYTRAVASFMENCVGRLKRSLKNARATRDRERAEKAARRSGGQEAGE